MVKHYQSVCCCEMLNVQVITSYKNVIITFAFWNQHLDRSIKNGFVTVSSILSLRPGQYAHNYPSIYSLVHLGAFHYRTTLLLRLFI